MNARDRQYPPRRNWRAFQSPHGDFGFLNFICSNTKEMRPMMQFQSPHGDFGFLNTTSIPA
ncbi:MAG: hypothetical protein NZQ09_17080 [Chloroflexus sp.]|nr:hypothetical protein [Chloroflexus sp.]